MHDQNWQSSRWHNVKRNYTAKEVDRLKNFFTH